MRNPYRGMTIIQERTSPYSHKRARQVQSQSPETDRNTYCS